MVSYAAALVLVLLFLSSAVKILNEYERGSFPARARDRVQGPRPHPPHPRHRQDDPGGPARRGDGRPRAGRHHAGQRHHQGERRPVFPRHRPEPGDHRRGELPLRDVPALPDDLAIGLRPGRARRTPGGTGEDQRNTSRRSSTRTRNRGASRSRRWRSRTSTCRRRCRGRSPSRRRPSGSGAPRSSAPRGVPGGPETFRRGEDHRREPDRAAAALPPDAAGSGGREQLDDHLPVRSTC